MLTSDLVRVSVKGQDICPRFVALTSLQKSRAAALIETIESHVGRTHGDLMEAIADLVAERTDFKLQKGLAKLLLDGSDFTVQSQVEPMALRRAVFARVAEVGPVAADDSSRFGTSRRDVLAYVGNQFSMSPEEVEETLYADLKSEQRMVSCREMEPLELLERYNTALVQGVLLRAHSLRISWRGTDLLRLQAIFRAVRFHRLIHNIELEGDAVVITLDGPLSLFRLSSKYGLQLAIFFPALVLASGWEAEADVTWNGERLRLRVSESDGLSSHYKDRGTWHSDEEKAFRAWLGDGRNGWVLDEEPMLEALPGGQVWIPDLALRHESGFRVCLELVWYWRKESLASRVKRLAEHVKTPAILLVSERLQVGEDGLDTGSAPVVRFKGVLPGKRIVETAEQLRKEAMK